MKKTVHIAGEKWLKLVFILMPVISLVSYIFPFPVKWVSNKLLRSFKNYYGHLTKIRFTLFPCSCTIYNFHFDKVNPLTQDQPLFFSAEKLKLIFEWRTLWNGILVCDIIANIPDFTFVKNTERKEKIAAIRSEFNLGFPVLVKTFEVKQGILEYIDQSLPSTLELRATEINATGNHLANFHLIDTPLTEVEISGRVYDGILTGSLKADLLSVQPSFDVKMEVKDINMVLLNNFFEAYGKFDVSSGSLGLFTEVSASGGKFSGYVKPFIRDLDIFSTMDLKKGFFRTLWEGVVGSVAGFLQNPNKDELATKIKFNGSFNKLKINVWYAVMETLRNAFISALKPSFDTRMPAR